MTVQGLMGAPVFWLGGSPLLAYNLLVMAGLALSAWAMWLLLKRWTGSSAAGAVAGSLLAFNAHTLTRLPHLQALHLEFMPVVLLALAVALTVCSWSGARVTPSFSVSPARSRD